MADHQVPAAFPLRRFKRREHLARPPEAKQGLYRLEEGWAGQYRLLKDGRRQITALFLPGDYCEPQWLLAGKPTLPVMALTPLTAYTIPLNQIHKRAPQATDSTSSILSAMLKAITSRERWIVNLGRMTATERICDLICEVFERMQSAGRAAHNCCAMPLTQYELADIVGISPVHVNRVLQMLRGEGVIELSNRRLVLRDPAAVRRMSDPRFAAVVA